MVTRIISITNQKGGVGKTTTSINLSAGLAARGRRVLLIDMDPQSNSTINFQIDPEDSIPTMYEKLVEDNDINWKKIIRETGIQNLHIAPSSLNLAAADYFLLNKKDKSILLERLIREIRDSYDYILIDCPPSLGILTVNSLYASTEVIIPTQLTYFAFEGLKQLLKIIEMTKKDLGNSKLRISGIIPTFYNKRTKMTRKIINDIIDKFGEKNILTPIPKNTSLDEAASEHKTINSFRRNASGAKAYEKLTEEIIGQEKQNGKK
ncbi:MAG: AAA family ATPase [bacterium]|nr:AAA family ATPase [bacterium]